MSNFIISALVCYYVDDYFHFKLLCPLDEIVQHFQWIKTVHFFCQIDTVPTFSLMVILRKNTYAMDDNRKMFQHKCWCDV